MSRPTKAQVVARNRELTKVNEGLRRHVLIQGRALEELGGALLKSHGAACGCVWCRMAELYALAPRQMQIRGAA